jgi:hypothetical protein
VRAVAIGRNEIADMGYVVFDSGLLNAANIEVRENIGKSIDEGANPWHRDLVLSGNKLVALTKAILRHGESGTVLKRRLVELVEAGVQAGQLPTKVLSKIKHHGPAQPIQ